MAEELTPKQQRFVAEYLINLNGKQAAIRSGYSPKTAEVQASRLLSIAKVAAAVAEGKKSAAEKLGITRERVLKEYARLAFLDIRRAFDDEGRLKPIQDIDDDTAAAIAGLETESLFEGRGEDREHIGTLKKIKLSDKKAALDSLAKHLGLLSDQSNVTLNLNGQVSVYIPDNGRGNRD